MSSTRIRLPFVRTAGDGDAGTAMEMIAAAFLRAGVPTAPRGMGIVLHIYAAPANGKGALGIAALVKEALDGLAWEDFDSQVWALDVIKSDRHGPANQIIDIWIKREDGEDE